MLQEVELYEKRGSLAGMLSFGQSKLLEIQRCIAAGARLLMLDEPAAGLSPGMIEKLQLHVTSLRDRGVTVFLIEHHMGFVGTMADRVVALDAGRKVTEGTPEEVRNHKDLSAAYLGNMRNP